MFERQAPALWQNTSQYDVIADCAAQSPMLPAGAQPAPLATVRRGHGRITMPRTISMLSAMAVCLAASAAAAPLPQNPTLVAVLTGGAEPAHGDPDGDGSVGIKVDPARLQLCYHIIAKGIAPAQAAQIHRGPPGADGPPVVKLLPPKDGESRGCVEVTAYEANEFRRRPQAFYVSIQNDEYPGGALRGQLTQ
jgi:hypothetical protein